MFRRLGSIPSPLFCLLGEMVSGVKPWPLFLGGSPGSGKTCACLALCDHVAGSRYRSFHVFMRELRMAEAGRLHWYESGQGGEVRPERLWEMVRAANLFVLDEVGLRERASDFAYETLYDVLERRRQRPTIVTSNLSLDEVGRVYDDRVTSRLRAGHVAYVAGPDLRRGHR